MGCIKCGFTGESSEYDETAGGFVTIPCPDCHGVDGEEPDWVTEGPGCADRAGEGGAMQQVMERPGPEDYSPDPEKLLKVALKVLVRAQEALTSTEDAMTEYMAGEAIARAAMSAKEALELLEDVKEKEEPCKS